MNSSKSNFYDTDDDDSEDGDHNNDHGFRGLGFRRNRASGYSSCHDFGIWNSSSVDHIRPVEVLEQKSGVPSQAMLISRIGKTIEEHIDDLLHAIKGVSSRVTQLESKTRHLEHTMDDLKGTVEFMYAESEGKMRHLEKILGEVHAGIQFLKDKQGIAEAQMLLQRLQLSKSKASKLPSENRNHDVQRTSGLHSPSIPSAPPQAVSSFPLTASSSLSHGHQPNSPLHPPPLPQGMVSMLHGVQTSVMAHSPAMTSLPFGGSSSPLNPSPWPLPPSLISSQQKGATQIPPGAELSFASPLLQGNRQNLQFLDSVSQQYHFPVPASGAQQLPSISPHEPFLFAAYNTHASRLVPTNARFQSPSSQQLVEMPYTLFNGFPSSIPHSARASGTAPSPEQLHSGSFQSMASSYADAPLRRSFSGSNNASHSIRHYHEDGNGPSHLSLRTKDSPHSSDQPQLTPMKPLQYAIPIVSALDHAAGSGVNENKVSGADVIEKIAIMGFRRDLARDIVRKLKDGGQPVDLNTVLDKLMSHGGSPSSKG